ncbi:MAG: glycosyltransferase family 4 protein [Verrucomicrobia bacterium]|nr:glycosyltransferase family 4 protein [Verrucomicrobiota bacterium]
MQVAHLLRKYNPAEWGGTETAVKRLLDGLRSHGAISKVFCPQLDTPALCDPLENGGFAVERFKSFVPVWGISNSQKQQLISVGGNLMSFDLLPKLLREDFSIMHTHAGNRLGGIALTAAKLKRVPLVASIHGGVLDLPEKTRAYLQQPLKGGFEWGRVFGAIFQARKVLSEADAIFTCNKKEAELQQKAFPNKRVIVQPHGVPAAEYAKDYRADAKITFPQIIGKDVLLVVGRIDPVKNQMWVVEQAPSILQRFPNTLLVFAGACTDASYGKAIEKKIEELGLRHRILLTGGLPPGDPRLIGLFQEAKAVLLPSISETFGLVILESWAAGTAVISSKNSGAIDLISPGINGWIFDLEDPATFHEAVQAALSNPEVAQRFAAHGCNFVRENFDTAVLGGRVKKLYAELIEEKQ